MRALPQRLAACGFRRYFANSFHYRISHPLRDAFCGKERRRDNYRNDEKDPFCKYGSKRIIREKECVCAIKISQMLFTRELHEFETIRRNIANEIINTQNCEDEEDRTSFAKRSKFVINDEREKKLLFTTQWCKSIEIDTLYGERKQKTIVNVGC